MAAQEVHFTNPQGLRLTATLRLPPARGAPLVIFSHGLYSGRSSARNMRIAQALLEKGIASLLLDFTGHGSSEGSIGPDFINQQVADLGAALDWVATRKEIDSERIGVNGSSTGGNVAILRAATDPRIRVLVLRSPPCEGLYEVARRIAVPTLIVQGELDPVRVQTRRLFEVLTCEKKYTLIKGASHLYETPEALDQMIRATVDWFVDKLSG